MARATSGRDAGSIGPTTQDNAWDEVVEVEEAARAHRKLQPESLAEDQSDSPTRDAFVLEGPRF